MREMMLSTRMRLAVIVAAAALVITAAICACAIPGTAYAEKLEGAKDWVVTFTTDDTMKDNFSKEETQREWADQLSKMEPGDEVTLSVKLYEENADAADWYMANEVLKTLEQLAEDEAHGSSYEYLLTYTNPSGSVTTLYDSENVGGNPEEGKPEGLLNATDSLDEFFYLDNLKHGETAHVNLRIAMDGETEQNAYFNTIAQVQMMFAVEKTSATPASKNDTSSRTVVKTGDETDLLPAYIVMTVSGLLLLVLAISSIRSRNRDRKEGAR